MRTPETPAFIGRLDQLGLLTRALRSVEAGDSQVVVVGGDAGIGKTRLVEHFAERAAKCRILRGNCVELGASGLPLASFTSVVRDVVAERGAAGVSDLVPDAEPLLRLLPELAARDAGPHDQARLVAAFEALLCRLSAERTLLLVIDDLHWADQATRDLLGVLARTLRSAPVLILAAYRADALVRGHPLPAYLAELERLRTVQHIQLTPFARPQTAELISGVRGDLAPAPVVDRIFRRTRGNPFFIEELARCEADALPESLRRLLLDQVERLPETARDVVRTAAVGAETVTPPLIAAVTGLSSDALLQAFRLAVDARVLTPVPGEDRYRFRHALVQEAIASDLLPGERIGLHCSYAAALDADSTVVRADRYAVALASHWYGAGDADRAVPALLRAADAAEEVYAFAEHSTMLLRALELLPPDSDLHRQRRIELWEKAVTSAVWAGDSDHALELIDRAAADGQTAMLLALRCMALFELCRDGIDDAVRTALASLAPGPTVERARVLDLLAAVLMMRRQPDQARKLCEEAIPVAAARDLTTVELNAQITLATALGQLGDHDSALEGLRRAAEQAARCDDVMRLARAQVNRAYLLMAIGRCRDAVDAARAGLDAGMQAGLARAMVPAIRANLADSLYAIGEWDQADAVCVDGMALDPPGRQGVNLLALRGLIALGRGKITAARELLRQAIALCANEMGPATLMVAVYDIEIALHDGRIDDARRSVRSALPAVADCNSLVVVWQLLLVGARACRDVDDDGLVDSLLSIVSRLQTNTPRLAAFAAQFKAELDEPDASWREVVAAWDELGEPYSAAYARLRLVATGGAQGDAGEQLRLAIADARRLDAQPLLGQLELLARSAGQPLATEDNSMPDARRLGLTRRETEVLRQLAVGRTNPQIAERLFISRKTASVHVSRILRKLGVATRGEAAFTAHRLRLFDGEASSGAARSDPSEAGEDQQ